MVDSAAPLQESARNLAMYYDLSALEEVLEAIGANAAMHGDRTLADHLKGTYHVLRRWGIRDAVAVAGMFHSVYSTEFFHYQTVPLERRPLLQEVIGQESERLAFLFAVSSRELLRQAMASIPAGTTAVKVNIQHRFRSNDQLTLGECWDLLTIDAANISEQSVDNSGFPSVWLSSLSHSELLAKRHGMSICPPLSTRVLPIELHDERQARDLYQEAFEDDGLFRSRQVAEYFKEVVRLLPEIAEGHLWLSYADFSDGEWEHGVLMAQEALRLLHVWGTTWDKRIGWSEACDLARALCQGDMRKEALTRMKRLGESWRRRIAPLPVARRSARYLQGVRDENQMGWYPGLSAIPWHNAQQFTVVHSMESRFRELREEVLALTNEGFHEEAEKIPRTGSWKVYMLWEAGRERHENCTRVPILTSILKQDPRVRRTSGLIYLSRLSPHTEITAHRGPTNLRLRLHMPFLVPEGDCQMRVADQTCGWSEGKALVFDDYYEHEVWNRTNQDRVVLVADLWHPDLSDAEVSLLTAIDSMIDMEAKSRLRYWQLNEQNRKKEHNANVSPSVLPKH